jgi:hypothetical protein
VVASSPTVSTPSPASAPAVPVETATASEPPAPEAPAAAPEQPCPLSKFVQQLASANDYRDPFDVQRAQAVDRQLAEQALFSRVGFTRGKQRVTVPRAEILKEFEARQGARFRELMRLGHSLAREFANPDQDSAIYPWGSGFVFSVGPDYQVRIHGEPCDGSVTEVRNTEGKRVPPLALKPDQPGFDCREDRRVFEDEPSKALVQRALNQRQREHAGTRLVHTIFPRSATPMIREMQYDAGGRCSLAYLGAHSEPDTCNGRKIYLIEAPVGLDCCSAEACDHDVSFYFSSFMDALSLQRASEIKSHIRPGHALKLTGYPFDADRDLTRSTPNSEVVAAFAQGPGWVGGDFGRCSVPPSNEVDYGDGGPWIAECSFGGGGQNFSIHFWRAGEGKRWYVTRISGEAH